MFSKRAGKRLPAVALNTGVKPHKRQKREEHWLNPYVE